MSELPRRISLKDDATVLNRPLKVSPDFVEDVANNLQLIRDSFHYGNDF